MDSGITAPGIIPGIIPVTIPVTIPVKTFRFSFQIPYFPLIPAWQK
jgi:hypothetical protein